MSATITDVTRPHDPRLPRLPDRAGRRGGAAACSAAPTCRPAAPPAATRRASCATAAPRYRGHDVADGRRATSTSVIGPGGHRPRRGRPGAPSTASSASSTARRTRAGWAPTRSSACRWPRPAPPPPAAGLPLHRYLRAGSCVLPVPDDQPHRRRPPHLQRPRLPGVHHACRSARRRFSEAMRMASECHMALQEIVVARYGKLSANTGDEGDFATPIVDVREALAGGARGRGGGRATRTTWSTPSTAPRPTSGTRRRGPTRSAAASTRPRSMIDLYDELVRDFGVVSIEDPLHEDDWEGWAELDARRLGPDVQIVGDDLFVTNPELVRQGVGAGRRQRAAVEGQPDRHADARRSRRPRWPSAPATASA